MIPTFSPKTLTNFHISMEDVPFGMECTRLLNGGIIFTAKVLGVHILSLFLPCTPFPPGSHFQIQSHYHNFVPNSTNVVIFLIPHTALSCLPSKSGSNTTILRPLIFLCLLPLSPLLTFHQKRKIPPKNSPQTPKHFSTEEHSRLLIVSDGFWLESIQWGIFLPWEQMLGYDLNRRSSGDQ